MNERLFFNAKTQLRKALKHLETSFAKVTVLKTDVSKMTDDELETWESFSSRFSRASDIFISKVLRGWALKRDPAFRGSLIDLLNEAEKNGVIDSANVWARIRELRNVAAHEYAEEDLSNLFDEIRKLAPKILTAGKNFP